MISAYLLKSYPSLSSAFLQDLPDQHSPIHGILVTLDLLIILVSLTCQNDDVPRLSITGCSALKSLQLVDCSISGDLPVTGLGTAHLDYINFTHCDGLINLPSGSDNVTIIGQYVSLAIAGGNPDIKTLGLSYDSSVWNEYESTCFKSVNLSNLTSLENDPEIRAEQINISGLPSKKLKFYATRSIEVGACPNLQELEIRVSPDFALSGLGSFPGLPSLTRFTIDPDLKEADGKYTCALIGLVPEIIDRVRNKGGSAGYPVRYMYTFDRTLGENGKRGKWRMDFDRGYGFYYSGEPSPRCYHYPKPDNYDYYNN